MNRSPLPPFTIETAIQKVRLSEDAWNTRGCRAVGWRATRR
jgi:nuclear transport factor 2 (NTF2) superfamily protein